MYSQYGSNKYFSEKKKREQAIPIPSNSHERRRSFPLSISKHPFRCCIVRSSSGKCDYFYAFQFIHMKYACIYFLEKTYFRQDPGTVIGEEEDRNESERNINYYMYSNNIIRVVGSFSQIAPEQKQEALHFFIPSPSFPLGLLDRESRFHHSFIYT